MPKKLCCCDDRREVSLIPHWVAVPCVEYLSHLYNNIGDNIIWPDVPALENEPGMTYPYEYYESETIIQFDYERQVFGMLRGGGGGGKTGDSISEPVKGGNAAYAEKIFAPTPYRGFYVGPGGSGPEALDIHVAEDFSGAQGYPKAAWGGSLSAFGDPPLFFIPTIAAGGGGGGTKNYTEGGHGGVTQGISGGSNLLEEAYGGWGGTDLNGGTSGLIGFGSASGNPENGKPVIGGRGQVFPVSGPIVAYDYAGGGGGAGYYGGGGGASGGGGGGGSSDIGGGPVAIPYPTALFPGTDTGPGSRCNPYFLFDKDYGLGANRTGRSIEDCEVYEGCPESVITFQTGTTGMHGVAATYFRNKWCTCTETQEEAKKVPVPNYICLTQEQYLKIIDQQPTTNAPPGEDVKLSFLLNDKRYLLLYKCNIGCENEYLVSGEPTEVKWYIKGLNPTWFEENPEWASEVDNLTACCDCYDCEPICKSAGAPGDLPEPPRVRSCLEIEGATCYWHLDESDSLWYYKCKKSNCWADFRKYLPLPYIQKDMDSNTEFQCGEDPCGDLTWIANKCELITRSDCCEVAPCCGPAQIKFCDNHLRKLIEATYPDNYPINTELYCYYFKYLNCLYIISNSVTSPPCIPGLSTPENPINQGELFAITNKDGLDCCREGLFAGGTDPDAIKPPPGPVSCEDVIVECFPFADQFGVVIPVKVSSPMSAPGFEGGILPQIRCKDAADAEPHKYPVVSPNHVQQFGLCYQLRASETMIYPLSEYVYGHFYIEKEVSYQCPDCPNAMVVCDCGCPEDGEGEGSDGPNGPTPLGCTPPCEETPAHCDSFLKADQSYRVDTRYKVGASGKFITNFTTDSANETFYKKRAIALKFDLCWAQRDGIDIEDESSLFEFYKTKVAITSNIQKDLREPWTHVPRCPVSVGLEEEPLGAMCIKICDYEVKCFSGNAGHICEKINGKLAGVVEATGLWPYFWFGWRRGCIQCGKSANIAPPRFLGDDLEVDGGEVQSNKYVLYLAGVSQRWYVAACQSLSPTTTPGQSVINMSVGANHISQAEYAEGIRYNMKEVLSQSTTTALGPNCPEVTLCEADGEYPNSSVLISGDTIFYGFQALANNNQPEDIRMFGCEQPYRSCDVYNYEYEVSPCEGEGNILCEGCDNGVPYPFGCLQETVIGRRQGGNITVS